MNTQLIYVITFFLVILITAIAAFIANRFFKRLILKSTTELKNDPTNYQFLRRVVIVGIYTIGFSIAIYTVPSLRSLASSLLAGVGIFAVAIGFASQHALSNIISGFFIIIFKPFRVNDRLQIKDMIGIVEDITLRHVVIRDFTNKRIVIPNSVISQESLINADLVEDRICKLIDVGISYSSDIDKAIEIIRSEIVKHPLHIDPRTQQMIEAGDALAPVRVVSLGESSVNLRGWAWAKNSSDAFLMSCDLLKSIKTRFDKEGVIIPFPQRELHITTEDSYKLKDA